MQIKYREGYKYQLWESFSVKTALLSYDIETHFIKLSPDGMLLLRAGYASDGPSGPTWDTKDSLPGAFVHDAGYQLIREGLLPLGYRGYFDELFYDILRECGMSAIRAWLWRKAVVGFARDAALPENDRKVLTAP